MLVSAFNTLVVSVCRHDQAQARVCRCVVCDTKPPSTLDRASLHLLHGARRWRTQGACSSLSFGTRVESACRHDQALARVCRCVVCDDGAAINAPTDRASLHLLHGARRWRTQGACSSLPLALGWRVLAVMTRHRHVSAGASFATTEPPSTLRLIEQACTCSTVHGGGGFNDSLKALADSRTHSSKCATGLWSQAEVDVRCVLVSAAGTSTNQAPNELP